MTTEQLVADFRRSGVELFVIDEGEGVLGELEGLAEERQAEATGRERLVGGRGHVSRGRSGVAAGALHGSLKERREGESSMSDADHQQLIEVLDDFVARADHYDPAGKFRNRHLEQLFG